jgi:two-component system response regulator NreC
MSPGTSIVVLTMEDDPAWARDAFAAGASGFVLKDAPQPELVRAVRQAAARGANP